MKYCVTFIFKFYFQSYFFQDIYARYTFYLDKKLIETKKIPNTINPDWNFTQLHAIPKCTQEVTIGYVICCT